MNGNTATRYRPENRQKESPLATAISVIDGVDALLAEAGYQPDSSTRHQLSIVRAILTDLQNSKGAWTILNGNIGVLPAPDRSARIDDMVLAFTEHCECGGRDFLEYLNTWQTHDALETINDAAQNYTTEAAIGIIKAALGELYEIAAQGHREALEWEGVE